MDSIVCENFLTEQLGVNKDVVYAVTLIKLLLNRKKCDAFYAKVAGATGAYGPVISSDNSECEQCKSTREKSPDHICRSHRSLHRVVYPENNTVLRDVYTGYYFIKNELFRPTDDGQVVVISCPHPKLILGQITDEKVRLVNLFVGSDYAKTTTNPTIIEFSTEELFKTSVSLWFNKSFTMLTKPKDNDYTDWCLIPNKVHSLASRK